MQFDALPAASATVHGRRRVPVVEHGLSPAHRVMQQQERPTVLHMLSEMRDLGRQHSVDDGDASYRSCRPRNGQAERALR